MNFKEKYYFKVILLCVVLFSLLPNLVAAQNGNTFPIGVWLFRPHIPDSNPSGAVPQYQQTTIRNLGINYIIDSWIRRETNVMNF